MSLQPYNFKDKNKTRTNYLNYLRTKDKEEYNKNATNTKAQEFLLGNKVLEGESEMFPKPRQFFCHHIFFLSFSFPFPSASSWWFLFSLIPISFPLIIPLSYIISLLLIYLASHIINQEIILTLLDIIYQRYCWILRIQFNIFIFYFRKENI